MTPLKTIHSKSGTNLSHRHLSSLRRTRSIFQTTENAIDAKIEVIGTKNFLDSVGQITDELCDIHIDGHRAFIRENTWQNEFHNTSHAKFLEDFERSSALYIDVSFEIFSEIVSGNFPKNDLISKLYSVEALRGQYGKRSPTGLDQRLEGYCIQLEETLSTIPGMDTDDFIDKVSCPGIRGESSAEELLCEDFSKLYSISREAPDRLAVANMSKQDFQIFNTFFRRHAKWSWKLLQGYYDQLDVRLIENQTRDMLARRQIFRCDLESKFRTLSVELSASQFEFACELGNKLAELNHLNVTLEPICSFKGAPGMMQFAGISQLATPIGADDAVLFERAKKSKWGLMYQGDHNEN